jgi:hypothetical protein
VFGVALITLLARSQAALLASCVLCVDGWSLWQSEAEAEAEALAKAAVEKETQESTAATAVAAIVGVIFVALALLAAFVKSPKQRRMEHAKAQQAKDEESIRRIAAQANTEKQVDPTPIKIDNVAIAESKSRMRSARKGNMKSNNGEDAASAGAAHKLAALAAKKPLAVGAVDHFQAFENKNGLELLQQVMDIYKRHQMINPYLHPTEPYAKCWEEKWMPLEESRDPDGEAMVERLAKGFRAKHAKFEVLLSPFQPSAPLPIFLLTGWHNTGPDIPSRLHLTIFGPEHR